ncbi:prolipoprotein diacylglyceryl transferase [Stackebrandtia endophytica]|uniref:Phosphatidylglycerol--prolipoprotein diacylglyceryl transferase n=1 Tax=Stackebrandtia endophytica TaxID=1496996 RepID=A0A543AQL4_9ACTN|nr:prolipoprotein diacylglyceryl transferase [Stackebrandtia endophytica]TQL74825.1 prolipoprotein diacylglyceryl transferase [Stackebrandtia endophytica]
MDLAYIPSPPQDTWYLFDLIPLRGYALSIIVGIIVACWITEARLRRRGAPAGTIIDLAVWAVPFGILGGRIYHLITSPEKYFGEGGEPIKAFFIWEGGLGIPGAVAMGGLGVWIACRKSPISFAMVAGAIAPALPVAQAIGRIGNWFNQELYGLPTTLPWGLEIDRAHQINIIPPEYYGAAAYHPTFLYELLWNLGIALVVWQLDRHFKFGRGRAFAIYVLGYGLGRFWIEGLRIDPANDFLGLRVNEWMALAMVVAAVIYLLRVQGKQEVLVSDGEGGYRVVDWDSDEGVAMTKALDESKHDKGEPDDDTSDTEKSEETDGEAVATDDPPSNDESGPTK